MNSKSYTYGTKPHAVTLVQDGSSYTYDNNGNMRFRGSHELTWTVENRLASYNDGSTTAFYVNGWDANNLTS